MKLLTKFSLVFALVFGTGLGIAGVLFQRQLQDSAREQVLYQAQIMMETALAMRSYTTEQVRPMVKTLQGAPAPEQPDDSVFRELCMRKLAVHREFRPQTVPAFAATEMFNFLRKKYPDYYYKEAALNPSNPRNRAADWEEDIIKVFRTQPELERFQGERMTPFGPSLFLARPMRAGKACLECHTTPAAAPVEMVALYGPSNGFGWKEGEVIAAQIVSVPVTLPMQMANRAFSRLVISLAIVAGLTLVLLNVVLYLTVIRPVSRLALTADEISKGNLDVPELTVTGSDEISVLGGAFNRMHRSLVAAMKMLERP
jgi:HAMP domain-containing protein